MIDPIAKETCERALEIVSMLTVKEDVERTVELTANSVEDVEALATMSLLSNVDDENILRNFNMTSSWVEKYYNFHSETKRNIDSFQEQLHTGMIEKTAIKWTEL